MKKTIGSFTIKCTLMPLVFVQHYIYLKNLIYESDNSFGCSGAAGLLWM